MREKGGERNLRLVLVSPDVFSPFFCWNCGVRSKVESIETKDHTSRFLVNRNKQ